MFSKSRDEARNRAFKATDALMGEVKSIGEMRYHFHRNRDYARQMLLDSAGFANCEEKYQSVYQQQIESFDIKKLFALPARKAELLAVKTFLLANLDHLLALKKKHPQQDHLTILLICIENSIDSSDGLNIAAKNKIESDIELILKDEYGMSSDAIEDEMRRRINEVSTILNPDSEKELKQTGNNTAYRAFNGNAYSLREMADLNFARGDTPKTLIYSFLALIYSVRKSDQMKYQQIISNVKSKNLQPFILKACCNEEMMKLLRSLKNKYKPIELVLLTEQLICRMPGSHNSKQLPERITATLESMVMDLFRPQNQAEIYVRQTQATAQIKQKREEILQWSKSFRTPSEMKEEKAPLVALPISHDATQRSLPQAQVISAAPQIILPVATPAKSLTTTKLLHSLEQQVPTPIVAQPPPSQPPSYQSIAPELPPPPYVAQPSKVFDENSILDAGFFPAPNAGLKPASECGPAIPVAAPVTNRAPRIQI